MNEHLTWIFIYFDVDGDSLDVDVHIDGLIVDLIHHIFRIVSRMNISALTRFPVIVEMAAPLSSMWPKLAAVLILYADVKYRKYRLTQKHKNTQTHKHTWGGEV